MIEALEEKKQELLDKDDSLAECPECGNIVSRTDIYCGSCGMKLDYIYSYVKDKEKIAEYVIDEYINHYCPNPSVLTQNEMKQIKYYYRYLGIDAVEFNKKGHLVFRQRYPYLPIYLTSLALVIEVLIILLGFISANK